MRSAFTRALSTATWPWSIGQLTAAGVKPSTLRGPRWRSTSRGWYVPADTPSNPTQRILDVAALIPRTGALSGWAAAYVLGVDWLDGLDPFTMAPQQLVISLGSQAGRLHTRSVRYTRDRLPAHHRMVRYGIRMTTPERTAFDGAPLPARLAPVALWELASSSLFAERNSVFRSSFLRSPAERSSDARRAGHLTRKSPASGRVHARLAASPGERAYLRSRRTAPGCR